MRESNSRKLTVAGMRTLRKPGMYGDGAGLWLAVSAPDRRAWVLRYTAAGKARQMTLGNAEHVGLAEARQLASDARGQVSRGVDPLAERQAVTAPAPTVPTFAEAAERYIASHETGWRNDKHRQQWRSTIAGHAADIGSLPVSAVDTPAVLRVLEAIWHAKPETASRLRGRIEQILDYSRVQGWRDGPNPAAWRGHLALALPARNRVAPVEHHAALSWREHRVPLSAAAVAVLDIMAELPHERHDYVFPGQRIRRPLSDMSLTAVLRRMTLGHLTAHGFRSTFRDWCAETGQPGDVAEAALAHTLGSKTVAAYQRGDLLERRRQLMTDWAAYCYG